MTAALVEDDGEGLKLGQKGLGAVIAAVKFQLAAWAEIEPDAMDEDDFADLQNDIGHLETVLGALQAEFERRYPKHIVLP